MIEGYKPAFIGRGSLIESGVNKRSEAANRKYRAFIHFLKYQNKNNGVKKEPTNNTPSSVIASKLMGNDSSFMEK